MRVVILHNQVAPGADEAERDVLVQAAAVEGALRELGHEPVRLDCTLDLEAARLKLLQLTPDCAFNLVESLGGFDWLACAATGLLDVLEVPYTGSPTEALLLSNHKVLAKQWLRRAGLPTPDWILPDSALLSPRAPRSGRGRGAGGEGASHQAPPTTHHSPLTAHQSPPGTPKGTVPFSLRENRDSPRENRDSPACAYLIKTVRDHASLGIGDQSIIRPADEPALRAALAEAARRLGREVFAERYVEGREFNLSLLAGPDGPEVLPPAEIDFSAFPAGKPRIVGYEAKWKEDSFEFHNTPRRFDYPESDRPLLDELARLARACWELFELRGYARVDFRVDEAARPSILEVNTNPCLSPDAGFAAAVGQAGLTFARTVDRILEDACRTRRLGAYARSFFQGLLAGQ